MNAYPDSQLFRSACERVSRFMEKTGMAERLPEGVLVALSGGADSVFLLYFLRQLSLERSFPLAAMHVHHHLRGAEADRDAAFCEALCRDLSVQFSLSHADVPAEATRRGRGIEETARILRYEALRKELAAHPELSLIATAHNATDRTETMLLHLLRGGGTRALRGIASLTDDLMRPLLQLTGEEIRSALREAKIGFVEDSTNGDTAYARNYLRHEILPRLAVLTPEPDRMFGRTAEILSADTAYLDSLSDEALRRGRTEEGFSSALLAELPSPIRRRVIIRLYEEARDAHAFSLSLGHTHILEIEKKLEGGHPFTLSVPAGLTAVSENCAFRFLPGSSSASEGKTIRLSGHDTPSGVCRGLLCGCDDNLYLATEEAQFAASACKGASACSGQCRNRRQNDTTGSGTATEKRNRATVTAGERGDEENQCIEKQGRRQGHEIEQGRHLRPRPDS